MSIGNLNRQNQFPPLFGQQQQSQGFQSSPFSQKTTQRPEADRQPNPFLGAPLNGGQGLDQLGVFKQQVAPNVNLQAPKPAGGMGNKLLAMG